MSDRMAIRESAVCEVVRAAPAHPVLDLLDPKGHFKVEHWREGKLIGTYECPNVITNEGKNRLLTTMFMDSKTRYGTWYLGLIDGAGSPVLAAGDTYDGINEANGWDEWDEISGTYRLPWTNGAAASQQMTNSTPVTFTMTAAGDIHGLFLVGGLVGTAVRDLNNTEQIASPNERILWCATAFASPVPVLNTDELKVTYTITIGA